MPDKPTLFRVLARFDKKKCNVSDRKVSGLPTAMNDGSVENIRNSLVKSPLKFKL